MNTVPHRYGGTAVKMATRKRSRGRKISNAVHRAYKGELCCQYTDEAKYLAGGVETLR